MARRGNPYPWIASQMRPFQAFSTRMNARLNGSLQLSDASRVWQSPAMRCKGLTFAEAHVTLTIQHDSAPGGSFALIGRLSQMMGSDGSSGPQDSVSFAIPGLPGKQYLGTGTYSFSQLVSGGRRSDITMANAARFELFALGRPLGRVLRIQIDGTIMAGWTY